jgi:rhodanese-related sulfurtransferase
MKHLNLIALGGIIIILGILFGIATIRVTGKYQFKKSAQEMLEKVTTETKQLSLYEAAEWINKDGVIFIDIRTPNEFVSYHIPNAINIPYDRLLDEEYVELLNNDQQKIIYGSSSIGANAVWLILTQYGYENLLALDGGADDWRKYIETKDIFQDKHKGDEVALFEYDKVMKGD